MKDLKVGDYIRFEGKIEIWEYLGVVMMNETLWVKLQICSDNDKKQCYSYYLYEPERKVLVLDIKHKFGDIVKDKVTGITIQIYTMYVTCLDPLIIAYQGKNFEERIPAKDACIIKPRDETIYECIMRRLDKIETRLSKLE